MTTTGVVSSEAQVEAFKAAFRGEVLRSGEPTYDEVRVVWNAMVDRKPSLIARCVGAADVINAVNFARHNLLSVDIVTADGQLRTASAEENEELFWGVRGGGGNFGIVTSFEYRLHPVGPLVLGGFLFHSISEARTVLRF
jgi:hypothetical protein